MKNIALLVFLLHLHCFAQTPKISVERMSLEEKVGQILMVHFHGTEVNEHAKALVEDLHIGAIIYYSWSNDLSDPTQVKHLSSGLQQLTLNTRLAIPLIIAADQEGGVVVRIKGLPVFPGNKSLGVTQDSDLAYQSAFAIGQELRSLGVNMNLAPVVDINSNPYNPSIGIRSFGDTPELVSAFSEQALRGYQTAGVISSIKHFPGYGDVFIDAHEDLPIIKKSMNELSAVEWVPFAKLASTADTIMTAHLLIPSIDPDHCSTLSKKTLGLLRNNLHFEGVIVSDSLVMEGILKHHTIDEASILALEAGCDILLLGGRQLIGADRKELSFQDVKRIHASLITAVKSGRISEEQLNNAVARILTVKARYLYSNEVTSFDGEEHQKLAEQIAKKSIVTLYSNIDPILAIQSPTILKIAPKILKEDLGTDSTFFFDELQPTELEISHALNLSTQSDIIVFYSYNAWRNPSQKVLIDKLLTTKKPFILIVTRDPIDAPLFLQANLTLLTHSPTSTALSAAREKLIEVIGNKF